jgi:hypothetical protein
VGIEWTGRVTSVAQVPKDQWREAVEWWTKNFGFEVIFEVPSFPWAELTSPATGMLFGVQGSDFKPPEDPPLILQVKNIEGAVAALEERGVTFTVPLYLIEGANVKIATLTDPWGNGVHLEEYL